MSTGKDDVMGKIIFSQDMDQDFSSISINLAGFEPNGNYIFTINESGDTTNKCANVGKVFNPNTETPP